MASSSSSDQDPQGAVYLDYNATSPPSEKVVETIMKYLREDWYNPSSGYPEGSGAKEAIAKARQQVANALNCAPEEVFFTSGATESINWSLKGVIHACIHGEGIDLNGEPPHIVTTAVEHPATLKTCEFAQQHLGAQVTYVGVNNEGIVSAEEVFNSIRPNTRFVSVMLANNEVGAIQPIAEIARLIRETPGLSQQLVFHTDASQVIGKIPVDFGQLDVDMMSVAGHKFYGPKGVGCLLMRTTTPIRLVNLMHGPAQERGYRAGTENVPYIAALGVACDEAKYKLDHRERERLHDLRELLKERILTGMKEVGDVKVIDNCPQASEKRLPNTLSIAFEGISASEVLAKSEGQVCASVGAACKKGKDHSSHVLKAMGIGQERARGTMRLSVGRHSTRDRVEYAARVLVQSAQECITSSHGARLADTRRLYMNDTYLLECNAYVVGRVKNSTMELHAEDAQANNMNSAEVQGANEAGLGEEVLILDQTVFHAQGGGQPADRGYIISQTTDYEPIVFEVHTVKNGTIVPSNGKSPLSVVLHFGRYVKRHNANVAPENIQSQDNGKPCINSPEEGENDSAAARFARGHGCKCLVNGVWRRNSARLHSGGHLIDEAMRQVGQNMEAGKGHHFPDGPFVEYIGDIPAREREQIAKELQKKVTDLISKQISTRIQMETSEDGSSVRTVYVGSEDQGCACGGTHVNHTGQIGDLKITKIKGKKGNTKVSYTIEDLEQYC
eukprot:gb/GECG01010657.1/.p1 GENE.gb/GECG01010657.1/~~gb/GECG01010657.1/.p1  ORF type:complete len:730 (+),score=85.55 gb/GECG01010657.1/:1-2190(+)